MVATGDGCFGEDCASSSAGLPLAEGEICSTRELFGRDRFRWQTRCFLCFSRTAFRLKVLWQISHSWRRFGSKIKMSNFENLLNKISCFFYEWIRTVSCSVRTHVTSVGESPIANVADVRLKEKVSWVEIQYWNAAETEPIAGALRCQADLGKSSIIHLFLTYFYTAKIISKGNFTFSPVWVLMWPSRSHCRANRLLQYGHTQLREICEQVRMWFLCSVRLVPTNLQCVQGNVFPELGEVVEDDGEFELLDGMSPSEPGVYSW